MRMFLFFILLVLGGCLTPGIWTKTQGTLSLEDGSHYEGQLQDKKPHGQGIQTWPDKAQYQGAFQQGFRTGKGVFTWPSGNRYQGMFKNGKRHGQGLFQWANGAQLTIRYHQGHPIGTGILRHPNGTEESLTYPTPANIEFKTEENIEPPLPATMPIQSPEEQIIKLKPDPGHRPQPHTSPRQILIPPMEKPTLPNQSLEAKKSFFFKTWRDPLSGIALNFIQKGCFTMGDNQGKPNEQPEHTVCLNDFWLGTHEITQGQWQQVMDKLPMQTNSGEDLPMENVSWNEIKNFIDMLNKLSKGHFRLPTEAEWEFACRNRGQKTPYCGNHADPTTFAWFNGTSGGVHPVGNLTPNELGLYDMNGNVWEWVADWYAEDYYQQAPKHNPTGPEKGTAKVFRGGAWLSEIPFLRATSRAELWPDRQYNLLGFRLAGTPPE